MAMTEYSPPAVTHTSTPTATTSHRQSQGATQSTATKHNPFPPSQFPTLLPTSTLGHSMAHQHSWWCPSLPMSCRPSGSTASAWAVSMTMNGAAGSSGYTGAGTNDAGSAGGAAGASLPPLPPLPPPAAAAAGLGFAAPLPAFAASAAAASAAAASSAALRSIASCNRNQHDTAAGKQ